MSFPSLIRINNFSIITVVLEKFAGSTERIISVSQVEIELKRCVCRYNHLQVHLPVGMKQKS